MPAAKVAVPVTLSKIFRHSGIYVRPGAGITKPSDLKGKRVSTGSPGSATEVMAFRVIEAAGLDKDKDMRRERLGVAARLGHAEAHVRTRRGGDLLVLHPLCPAVTRELRWRPSRGSR